MKWSPEQLALLREHYPNKQATELVILIGRTAHAIYHKAIQLNLKKSPEFLASPASGRLIPSVIGKEIIRTRDGYVIRKTNDGWLYAHVMEWETHNGPVPDGCILRFKDGNKLNTSIENLELITRKENLEANTIHRYPIEVIGVIRLQKKLKRTIERIENA